MAEGALLRAASPFGYPIQIFPPRENHRRTGGYIVTPRFMRQPLLASFSVRRLR